MKQLIINADDFGMCEGVNLGIIECHKAGILPSTTLMINMPHARQAIEMARNYPLLGIGIHLVLTLGQPLTLGNKSFTDENGNFRRPKDYPDGKPIVDPDELYHEWKAQIELFIKMVGRKPTHIDSHHHTHLIESNLKVARKLAEEYDLPLRLDHDINHHYEPAPLIRGFYGKVDFMKVCEEKLNVEGLHEMMCHPAFIDAFLLSNSSYNTDRAFEMDFLRSKEFSQWIKDHGIELINYSKVQKR